MKVSTVNEVFGMDDGDIIKSIRVRIKKVWDYKSGESDKGPWSFQNLTVTDGGKEITVSLQKRDEVKKSWEGKTVVFLAHQSDRGWSGVYASDNTYTNKDGVKVTKRIIKVTASAEMTAVVESGDGESSNQPAHEPSEDQPSSSPHREQPPQDPPKGTETLAARKHLGKAANLYQLCMRAARHVGEQFENENPGMLITPEQFQAICSALFIESSRAGMIQNMPSSPLPPPEKPAKKAKKEEPKPEPSEDYVPM